MMVWLVIIYFLSQFFHTNAEVLGIADNFAIVVPIFLVSMLVILWGIKKIFYKYIAKN